MTNRNLLKILFVEAVPSDADLSVLELRKEGLRFEHTRVDTRTEFIKALNDFRPDIIISDYMMPSYNGMQALKDAREFDPSIPFILYAASINEETVVKCLKAGADDYIIKEQMTRLPFAVKEALEKHRIQIEKRAAELLLEENEAKLQSIFRVAPIGMGLAVNRVIIEVNDTFCIMTGYNRKELIGKPTEMVVPTREEYEFISIEEKRLISEKGTASVESRLKCKDGRILNIITSATPLDPSDLSKGLIFTVLDITERKQAEKAQQESEEHYSILFNEAQDGICLADAETGLIIDCNQAMSSLVGKEWVELIGQSQTILHPPSIYKAAYSPTFEQHLTVKEGKTLETQIVTSTGIIREVEIKANQVNIHGRKTLLGVFRDITERKRGEEELIKNQTQLMNALKLAHLGSWEYDVENDIFIFNDPFYAIFRTTAEQVGGYTMKSAEYAKRFVHPDDIATVGSETRKAIETDDPNFSRQLEHRIIYADGETGYITVRFFVEKNEKGETVKTYGVNQDITERKKAEEALRESEEKYRRIFENVQDLFYETSIEGTIFDVSPSIELMSKGLYKRDDLIGKSMYEFYSDTNERAALISQIKEKGYVSDFEITLKNRDGSLIPCSISTKILLDAQGRPEKLIGSMRDITDRKNASDALKYAKEKAEASDKLKTTFLNNISHEVRTPLNGILGFAEIISQTDLSEEEKKLSHSMLFESSDRLLDTITNYMDISLITSGNMVVKRKDFIPEQIMMKLSGKYMTICSAGKLELLLKMPEHSDKLSVNSDPEVLNKIMSHLLNNAIKFTKIGSIQYGYTILDDEFEFFVKDTGIGIGKEFLDNIFELFVKEDRGPFRETEGSGLGLPISKGLVDLLGGKFRIESEIGKGSSVFFTIPQSKEKEIHHSVIRTDSQNRNKTIKSILVAEDEEINFFYLKALLKKNISAEIIHASDGKEALEKFQQNPDIGLILMDIKMPGMDGLEATRQIKDIKRNIPVIAITAYAMTGDEDKALEAGCDGYLTKPINRKQLFEKIAEFIKI